METNPRIKMYSITIDCPDPYQLALFYTSLLDWNIVYNDTEYVVISPPDVTQGSYPGITFQLNNNYKRPTWPTEDNKQQHMEHIDFIVDNLDVAVQHAIKCGAKIAPNQFNDMWTVMFDPVGHPFCLIQMNDLFNN